MTIDEIAKKYYLKLDDDFKSLIDRRVNEKGIEKYLDELLVYLDCTVIKHGMRMMQTIGFPYKKDISSYMYVMLNKVEFGSDTMEIYSAKLEERHKANIEFEKENPPIIYKDKKQKTTRTRKSKEPKEDKPKISRAEAKLKAKLLGANIGFGGFKIKNK